MVPSRFPGRQSVAVALARRFGVDARALAALRVALGTVLLLDLLLRARNLVAFYTDDGVFPRAALASEYPALRSLSVHALSGDAWVQALLFLAAVAFAVALLVGYRTRLATVGCLVLLLSLHARNPLVLNGGDKLLRRLLFWSVFLPLGERYAVDALGDDDPRERVANLASAAILLQVVLVYATNGVFKLRSGPWLRGDAVLAVLRLDRYATPLGELAVQWPALLAAVAWLWVAMVVASPLLVLATGRVRALLASAFVAAHLGMAATMYLGVFPLVSAVALLPFLPRFVWDRVDDALRSRAVQARLRDGLPLASPTAGGARRSRSGPRGRSALRWTRTGTLAALLAVMLAWNAFATGFVAAPDGPASALEEKGWTMFAPYPPDSEGWLVAEGARESGGAVDVLGPDTVRFDRPPDRAVPYPTARWRGYASSVRWNGESTLAAHFASYLCTRWSEANDGRLESVSLAYHDRPVDDDSPDAAAVRDLGTYRCPGDTGVGGSDGTA